jgi:hypothetical protein
MVAQDRTVSKARWPERLFDWLASPRGILFAALFWIFASAVAMVLTALVESLPSHSAGRLAEVLEIGDPFGSWWYGTALLFAASAALAALVEGIRRYRTPGHASIRLRATLPGACDPRLIAALLRQRVGRVTAGKAGGLESKRGRGHRAAPIVGSLGGLLLCAGVLWAVQGGEAGSVLVEEGGTAYGFKRRSAVWPVQVDLGAELQVERREPTVGPAPRWRLVLARGADVLAQADVGPGGELEHQGRRFRIEAVRPGKRPGRFRIQVAGGPEQSLALGEPVDVGSGVRITILAYDPDHRGRHGPAVKVAWSRPGADPEVGWIFSRFPDFDARVRRSRPPLVFSGYEARPELVIRVERSVGGALIVAGALLLLMGLVLFLGPRPARLEAHREEDRWVLRGEAGPGVRDLARVFDEIVGLLRSSPDGAARGPRGP